MFLLHMIDDDGHFELIDSDFRAFYDIADDKLIELTDAQYQQYLSINSDDITFKDGAFSGRPRQPSAVHQWDGTKWVVDTAKQTELNAKIVNELIDGIDTKAEEIYKFWTRFESEYRERQTAANEFKAAGYRGDVSRYIADFARHAGIDNKTATDLILVQAAGLEKLQVELANQRMRKYELKAPNLTIEQMQSIYDDIIATMDKLLEAYKNG